MEKYKFNTSTNQYNDVIYKSKNECGQLLNLTFEREEYPNTIYWNIAFWIGKRKRGYEYNIQTGRDGIKSLLWAKKCIINFIDTAEYNNKTQHLCIAWDNNKRRDTYVRGLKDLGFKLDRVGRDIWLHKII